MLILFNHQEQPIGRLTSRSLTSCVQSEPLNGLVMLDFTVNYESLDAMNEVSYVAHKDAVNANAIQMYKILSSVPDNQGMTYQGLHIVHDDMKGYGYIRERTLGGVQAGAALSVALEGSRWQVGSADPTEPGSVHFYDNSRQECITKILETWDVELGYRIVFTGNRITDRYIDLYARRGVETGRRYAYGRGALEVVREESQAGLYTAAIGRGKGEQKFDDDGDATGGFGRRINFAEVAWSKEAGDPVDKPAGQEFVEIPEMTAQFGYSDGSPRMKVCVYQDIEDPAILLQKTYEELLVNSRPLVQFRATITEAGNLELGDTVSIIRKELGIYYKTRVFSVKRDLLGGSLVEINLGDNLDVSQADYNRSLRKEIAAVENDISGAMESAVSWMQQTLTASMFDDDAYYYRMEMGNSYQLPAGLYTFDRPIDQNPTKALYFGAGKLAVSNRKDSQGRWIWSTWATGDGMVADLITSGTLVADLIKAGVLSGGNGKVTLDMVTGALDIDGDLTYNPATRVLTIGGTANINAANIKSGVLSSAQIPNLDAAKITSGMIDAQTINVQNLTVANQRYQRYETPTFTTGSNYAAKFSGSSVAFGANSAYITLKDTGGRGEFLVQGTSGAYGSGYSYEMNAGGVAGGTSRANTTRMIGAGANGVVIGDQSGSTVLRFYNGAMYYQGKKIVLNTDNRGIHYEKGEDMRLHRYGVNTHTAPDGKTVISATLWYENRDDMTGNLMSGNFHASADEYNAFLQDEITSEDLIKEKIAKLLDLNADADTELAIQEVREKVDEVNAQAVQAIEAARAEAETKIAEKDLEVSTLQQMIVELTLMLSMIGQQELPTEPDPEPPIEELPTETPEEPPVEDPPQEDPDIPPEEGAPDDTEPETPADPVADDPDTTPIDEGGQRGE